MLSLIRMSPRTDCKDTKRFGKQLFFMRETEKIKTKKRASQRASLLIIFEIFEICIYQQSINKVIWFCVHESNLRTIAEILLPSARPAICLLAIPITLPISFIDVAPVWAMMFFTSASISSSESCFGR